VCVCVCVRVYTDPVSSTPQRSGLHVQMILFHNTETRDNQIRHKFKSRYVVTLWRTSSRALTLEWKSSSHHQHA
jgi:hypothetical protein